MKLSKQQLNQIIKEEYSKILEESEDDPVADAITDCIMLIKNSGPTESLPRRALFRDVLATGDKARIKRTINVRSKEAAEKAARDHGVELKVDYIRAKAAQHLKSAYGAE